MQFTKPMIELVYEIRRVVSSDLKPVIKLANPDLFVELEKYYHRGASTVCKALIKELFSLVGEPWNSRIAVAAPTGGKPALASKLTSRVYRGRTQAVEMSSESKSQGQSANGKKRNQRMYRGQVVED